MCRNAKMQTHVNGMSRAAWCRADRSHCGPPQDRLPAVLVKCITHKNTICPLLKHCATAAALPTTLTPDNALTIVCLVPRSTLSAPSVPLSAPTAADGLAMRHRRRVAVSIFGFHPSSLSVECVPSQCSHGYSTSAILRSSRTAQPFRIDPARLLQAANLVGCAVTFSQSIRSVSAPPQSPSLTSAPDRRGPYSSPAARLWPLRSVRWQPPGPF